MSVTAAATSLLLAQQTGFLNPLVDLLIPAYIIGVLYFIYSVQSYRYQRLHSQYSLGKRPVTVEDDAEEKGESLGLDGEHHYTDDGTATSSGSSGNASTTASTTSLENFSGTWKSIPSKNVNYEEFLLFQGVPFLKRKVATSTIVTHIIDHQGNEFRLEVQPLDMKTTFNIDGEPTISYIGKKAFEDKMTRGPHGELILVKTNKEDGTEISATRILKGNKTLVMKQSVRNVNSGKKVFAEQTFEKAA